MKFAMKNGLAAYGRAANTEVNPIQQLVMLYEGAIKFLRLAAGDIESGDLPAKAEHTGRALDIISYLQSTLDFERGGEVAPALDSLYRNVTAATLRASAALDAAQMRLAANLLLPVRDAWAVNVNAAQTISPGAHNSTPDARLSLASAI